MAAQTPPGASPLSNAVPRRRCRLEVAAGGRPAAAADCSYPCHLAAIGDTVVANPLGMKVEHVVDPRLALERLLVEGGKRVAAALPGEALLGGSQRRLAGQADDQRVLIALHELHVFEPLRDFRADICSGQLRGEFLDAARQWSRTFGPGLHLLAKCLVVYDFDLIHDNLHAWTILRH